VYRTRFLVQQSVLAAFQLTSNEPQRQRTLTSFTQAWKIQNPLRFEAFKLARARVQEECEYVGGPTDAAIPEEHRDARDALALGVCVPSKFGLVILAPLT
jgi:hypothetical protein